MEEVIPFYYFVSYVYEEGIFGAILTVIEATHRHEITVFLYDLVSFKTYQKTALEKLGSNFFKLI